MIFVDTRYLTRAAMAASLATALSLSCAYAAPAADDAEAQAQEAWRDSIVQSDVPGEGCAYAAYPSTEWLKVPCAEAANVPAVPRINAVHGTVGNGTGDYIAAVSSGFISRTMGSFPKFETTGEEDGGTANSYSLQLNTNGFHSALCDGAAVPADCSAVAQFVLGPGEGFFEYWLDNWNTSPCPSGWNAYPSSTEWCYVASPAVLIPAEPASAVLETVKVSATAKARGLDRLIVTVGTEAYTTSDKDKVLDLATNWTESEFNIFGDCCGSEAVFNSGTSIKVRVGVTNGTTNAPNCVASSLTIETNNLTVGKICTAKGGTTPFIEFSESN